MLFWEPQGFLLGCDSIRSEKYYNNEKNRVNLCYWLIFLRDSLWQVFVDKSGCFVSDSFIFPWKNYQHKICNKVVSKTTGVIGGRQQFIDTDIIDPYEASDNGVVDKNDAALD